MRRPTARRQAVIWSVAMWLVCSAATGHAAEVHLGKEHGCMACHGMVRKQVGPGFAQIAERYRNDKEAPERLAGKIRNGSVGTWGRVIMPRQARITEPEARALALWVLSQPAPPPAMSSNAGAEARFKAPTFSWRLPPLRA